MAEQAGTAVQVKPVHEIVMSMLFGVGVEEDEEAQVRVLARIYAKGAKVPRDEVGILAGAFRHAIQVYTSYFRPGDGRVAEAGPCEHRGPEGTERRDDREDVEGQPR